MACFPAAQAELAIGLAAAQHCSVGCLYSSGPGKGESLPWYNILIPMASLELASTNKAAPPKSIIERIKEESQYAAHSSAFFSSPGVELAALLCSDTVGELDVTPVLPGIDYTLDGLLYTRSCLPSTPLADARFGLLHYLT